MIKPDPAIYQQVCEKFGPRPASCVFIDDMKENIDAAIALGMEGVQLTDKFNSAVVIDAIVKDMLDNRS